ncbi:radical SAM protein, partial [Patescibacteria group bacterium]
SYYKRAYSFFDSLEEETMMNEQLIELKAQMLCQGVNVDDAAVELFRQQNPSNVKRGGLSSGGKMQIGPIVVNAPFYFERKVQIRISRDMANPFGILIERGGVVVASGEVMQAPEWYVEKVDGIEITRILIAHNRQLAGSVYENCDLFKSGEECRFCVINRSATKNRAQLTKKSGELFVKALQAIGMYNYNYGGLSLNGGMTFNQGRGIELIVPVIEQIHKVFPRLPIAVEITPPENLVWINRLREAGCSSLMMNLECWDEKIREQIIPGKSKYCTKQMYLKAFKRALNVFGKGRVTTCFVVGTEPMESLKQGIEEVIKRGVIPSPLAGRYFEDVPDYPFVPDVNWREFLWVLKFAGEKLTDNGVLSRDRAGCVACGMCDLIRDM